MLPHQYMIPPISPDINAVIIEIPSGHVTECEMFIYNNETELINRQILTTNIRINNRLRQLLFTQTLIEDENDSQTRLNTNLVTVRLLILLFKNIFFPNDWLPCSHHLDEISKQKESLRKIHRMPKPSREESMLLFSANSNIIKTSLSL